jgi:putative sugar O-methyltransferase
MVASTWTLNENSQESYLAVCTRAAKSLGAFKRDHAYRMVLEHVSESQGRAYHDVILADSPQFAHYFKLFQQNDRYGAPITFNYNGLVFSPTTLRYVKVMSDLVHLFGSLDDFDIVEIGAGYGGQCKIIADMFAFQSYTLVDLAAVGALQERYLFTLGVRRWDCVTPEQLDTRAYDLVLSNYALSELNEEAQSFYVDKVLSRCRRGYLTWNSPKPFDAFGHRLAVAISDELPQTGQNNKIITWGPYFQSASEAAPALKCHRRIVSVGPDIRALPNE